MKLMQLSMSMMLVLILHGTVAGEEPVQTTCPVMEGNPINKDLYVNYHGRRVYFCCKICVSAFQENPEKYVGNLPAAEVGAVEPTSHAEHDHSSGHPQKYGWSRLIAFAGKFHPASIHIPIALVLAAAIAELLSVVMGIGSFRTVSRFNILFAVIGAVPASLLGLAAGAYSDYPETIISIFSLHRLFGLITVAAIVLTAAFCELSSRNANNARYAAGYRLILIVAVILVSVTGYFGGVLVYGQNHYTW